LGQLGELRRQGLLLPPGGLVVVPLLGGGFQLCDELARLPEPTLDIGPDHRFESVASNVLGDTALREKAPTGEPAVAAVPRAVVGTGAPAVGEPTATTFNEGPQEVGTEHCAHRMDAHPPQGGLRCIPDLGTDERWHLSDDHRPLVLRTPA